MDTLVLDRLIVRTPLSVEWGDCDAAGIVFYPRYFAWFDTCTQALLRAAGLGQREVQGLYGAIGTAAVHAQCDFVAPSSFDDRLEGESYVARWSPKTFTVRHTLRCGDRIVCHGHEVRTLPCRDADGRLRSMPIPDAFRRRFETPAEIALVGRSRRSASGLHLNCD